jgi:hypothetical protein
MSAIPPRADRVIIRQTVPAELVAAAATASCSTCYSKILVYFPLSNHHQGGLLREGKRRKILTSHMITPIIFLNRCLTLRTPLRNPPQQRRRRRLALPPFTGQSFRLRRRSLTSRRLLSCLRCYRRLAFRLLSRLFLGV